MHRLVFGRDRLTPPNSAAGGVARYRAWERMGVSRLSSTNAAGRSVVTSRSHPTRARLAVSQCTLA